MKTLARLAVVIVTMFSLQLTVTERAEAALIRSACKIGTTCITYSASGAGNIGGHDEITQLLWSLASSTSGSSTLMLQTYITRTDSSGSQTMILEELDLGVVSDLLALDQVNLSGFGEQQVLYSLMSTSSTSSGLSLETPSPLWNRKEVFGVLDFSGSNLALAWSPLATAAPVPEPSTFILLGAGAAGLAALHIRRRKAS